MTQLILEIPQNQDINLLLALCRRLNIRVISNRQQLSPVIANPDTHDVKTILEGLPANADFEALLRDFEESRKDRPLPGRE